MKSKILTFLMHAILAWSLLFAALDAARAESKTISLIINQSRLVKIPAGSSVKIKNGRHISVKDLPEGLLVTGKSPGVARITAGLDIYEVKVMPRMNKNFLSEMRGLLKSFRGLKLEIENGIVITGQLHRLSDWRDIATLATAYESNYKFAAKIDDEIKDEVVRYVHSRLRENNLPSFPVQFIPEPIVTAPSNSQSSLDRIAKALHPLGIDVRFDENQIVVKPLVRVKIVVAEINKSYQRELGFDWPEEVSAQLAPKSSEPKSIEVFLKMMEEKGEGQILASPNLLARSGSEADFLAGGEFAIKVVTSRRREVFWKKHGIFLKIKPVADLYGRLSIELSTEVSLVDASQTIEGVPALKTNRMSTHFDLAEPRTIVLSGLIRNDWGQSYSQVPFLGDIPVIGALFRSENFNKRKSELVIFVTPEILPQSEESADLYPKDWRQGDIQ